MPSTLIRPPMMFAPRQRSPRPNGAGTRAMFEMHFHRLAMFSCPKLACEGPAELGRQAGCRRRTRRVPHSRVEFMHPSIAQVEPEPISKEQSYYEHSKNHDKAHRSLCGELRGCPCAMNCYVCTYASYGPLLNMAWRPQPLVASCLAAHILSRRVRLV